MMQNALDKSLGIFAVIAFGLTNEIASGLFFVSTQIQQSSPGVGNLVPLLMILGGAITLVTVLAYRYFFASGLVGAGGEYVMISRSLSPGIAFVVTFLAWFGFTGALGTLAYAAPHFLAAAAQSFGAIGLGQFLSSTLGILLTGLIIIWGIWLVHIRGVRLAGLLVIISMVLVLVTALVLSVYGFATSPATFSQAIAQHLHMSATEIENHAPVQSVSWSTALWSALPVLFFGYLGLSTATQTGGEARNPKSDLPKAVLATVLLVTVVYTVFAFAVYHAVPWKVIGGLSALKLANDTTSSGLLQFVMPSWLGSLINLLVALIVIKTFLPIFMAQSRWVYAWGEDGVIPTVFSRTHKKYKSPVLALTISAVFGTISLIESAKLGYVFGVNVRVLSVMTVFFCMGLGMIVFPRHAPQLYKNNLSALAQRRGWQIIIGVFLMAISVWFAVSISLSSLNSPLILQPVIQSAIVAAIGVLIYLRFKAKLGRDAHSVVERFQDAPPQ